MREMKLQDLKAQTPAELVSFAEEKGVENASTMRKQELMFAILKQLAIQETDIIGEGVVEVLSDGFGFLRSPDANYLPGPDDIYVSPSQIRRFGLRTGDTIEGPKFAVSRESIRLFCDGSLDYNPLHLDDDYMKNSFGKTNFGGIIMHGMNNFGLITRMLTDWAYPAGAIHRRLETRWVKPVRPGDTIQPVGIVKAKQVTQKSRWVLIDVLVKNQSDEKVATGEAMVEFPLTAFAA